MRPTATEMLEILDHILETQIVPKLPDEHTRARMNVASQVLRAVHNRVRLEGQMLATDNAELARLLSELRDTEPTTEAEYVPVETLADRNDALRAELVEEIKRLDDRPEGDRATAESSVSDYLRRQLDREIAITSLPVFGETTAALPLV
jgi:hypothetical protein